MNRVVPLDRLEQETTEIARELAERPTLVLGYTKSAVVHGSQAPPRTGTRDRRFIIRNELEIYTEGIQGISGNTHPASVAAKALTGREETVGAMALNREIIELLIVTTSRLRTARCRCES